LEIVLRPRSTGKEKAMVLRRTRRRQLGFSVPEIVAVTAVIALLLAMGLLLYRSARSMARVAAAESNLKQISTAMELYFRQYNAYPPQGSDLTVELAPFVENPEVFNNPLMDEDVLGETINALYQAPSLDEIDRPNQYLTAMVAENWTPAVILSTGHRVQRRPDLTALNGSVNLNPRNDNFEFELRYKESEAGSVKTITRDDLLAWGNTYTYSGKAIWIRFCPKGNGNQNGLELNDADWPVDNGTIYTFAVDPTDDGSSITVYLHNDKWDKSGASMGKWWLDIYATDPEVTQGGVAVASTGGQ
jgi:type II secretory pathway pseudopilin PulG